MPSRAPASLVQPCRCIANPTALPTEQRRNFTRLPKTGEAGGSRWWAQKRPLSSSAPVRAAKKDPYSALGVSKSADKSEIKKAYYALAKKWHPDSNKEAGAKDRFAEIQEAYDTVGDEDKRKAYDTYGAAAQDPNFNAQAYEQARSAFGGGGGAGFGPSGFGAGSFNDFFANRGAAGGPGGARAAQDIFDQLFGGLGGGARAGSARPGRFQGEDIEVQMSVSFEDACKGTSRTIAVNPVVQHSECKGSGLKAGAKRQVCKTCGGSGMSSFTVQGNFHMQTTCQVCRGQGSTIPPGAICTGCQGVGVVRDQAFVPIDIPAGIEDGMRLRVPGRGDAPFEGNGQPGDLYVRVAVGTSKKFRRQGSNLFHDKTIPFHTAALGGTMSVPTLDEQISVRVPQGTQQGEEMVLRGRGVRRLNSTVKGDLTVKFTVTVPRSLTPLQRSLLEQFRDSVEGKPAPAPKPKAEAEPTPPQPEAAAASKEAEAPPRTSPNVEDPPAQQRPDTAA